MDHSQLFRLHFLFISFLAAILPAADIFAEEAKSSSAIVHDGLVLHGTQPLVENGELSTVMVAGLNRFLDRQLDDTVVQRQSRWKAYDANGQAFSDSIDKRRQRFREILGIVDERIDGEIEIIRRYAPRSSTGLPKNASVAKSEADFTVEHIRWPVFDSVYGEGLLLEPVGDVIANVIALPDATQLPEDIVGLTQKLATNDQFARQLAQNKCRVIVPVLISRESNYSGSQMLNRNTHLSHREWIWRMAFEVGRTPIGYEIQKVLAMVELFTKRFNRSSRDDTTPLPIAIAGYGDGGRVAYYSAALDSRIGSVWVSGYFDSHQKTWTEPVDRTVWGLLEEFGDAEIAGMIAPRPIVIEFNQGPIVDAWEHVKANQRGLPAPGNLTGLDRLSVKAEVDRARSMFPSVESSMTFVDAISDASLLPDRKRSLSIFLDSLGNRESKPNDLSPLPNDEHKSIDVSERQRRTVKELESFTQRLVAHSEQVRSKKFWNTIEQTAPEAWRVSQKAWRRVFEEQVIGKWDLPRVAIDPKSRPAIDTEGKRLANSDSQFTAWDVQLEVYRDVFAWGVLLLPNDLKKNERRPVVVCQHGLEGLPENCITTDQSSRAWSIYKAFATQLVERGFIVFVPHNPYRGGDEFRKLQRKSWLIGRHLFSLIHVQHATILDWLSAQSFVDDKRIAFYGLSYGGKSAMRIPAVHERYCLSICSGDFNEWVRKNAAIDYPSGYLYTPEYEIFEWDLGHTFNYAEMAALIAPRPFMVEHGFKDRVATAEWASYEYAKVRRFYSQLGIADSTAYEFFDGPHTIHGQGTFEFLHKHLDWPK